MSILDGFGAVPSNFTVPFTVATVAGSIGVAAGAVAAGCDILLLDCSVFSFLLQAAVASKPHKASVPTDILQPVFLFMNVALSLLFSSRPKLVVDSKKHLSSRGKRRILVPVCSAGVAFRGQAPGSLASLGMTTDKASLHQTAILPRTTARRMM